MKAAAAHSWRLAAVAENDVPALILAPLGRDATVAEGVLTQAGIVSRICPDLETLVQELGRAGCAVIAEEALAHANVTALAEWIVRQPPWSDFPFILLTLRGGSASTRLTEVLGNVTVLERPFHPSILVNAVRSALRARRRQREAEAYLEERKRSEEHQALLIRELHHRVKNTLATVLALLRATAGSAKTVDDFKKVFADRILALSRTHSLLVESSWRTAALADILRSELAPFAGEGSERVHLIGPEVELSADLAVPVGMAFHELTTNAAKYGALAVPEGRLEVRWDITETSEGRVLTFRWTERQGPPVEKPSRTGFGSKLIQQVLKHQCKADLRFDFDRDGLSFFLELPLPAAPTNPAPEQSPSANPVSSARPLLGHATRGVAPVAARWEP
ncbi:sensor histidine kinase [Microvirga arsenatis]|uniref:histidine kinase n=1 Tax=Microvirga arsenatis TaxID=2692265 RepID=A0ABW9Z3T5_9HYPH|nr:sensor histidine kinase [Microvirga arsenatis]NBJ13449.1 sensor histidine kinase [Microvirga arsenatis]NBJ27013.1 sensor histidine kinase [Microvirga arsenatis]